MIKRLRRKLHLSQVEFARLFGTHPITVSKWERGVTRPTPWQLSLMEVIEPVAFDVSRCLAFGTPAKTLGYLLHKGTQ